MGRAALKDCPMCGKPAVEQFRPFCSLRCANIDLGRWLGERYAVPAVEDDPEADSIGEEGQQGA